MITMTKQDIQEWACENEPSKEMRYYDGYWRQICFVRDRLWRIFFPESGLEARSNIQVISNHTSKSIKLPVYQITVPQYSLVITLRDNFHGWMVSVDSYMPIECDFMNLFNEREDIPSIYCEGFPEKLVFKMYKSNKNKFTVDISEDHKLFTFVWVLNNYFKCL